MTTESNNNNNIKINLQQINRKLTSDINNHVACKAANTKDCPSSLTSSELKQISDYDQKTQIPQNEVEQQFQVLYTMWKKLYGQQQHSRQEGFVTSSEQQLPPQFGDVHIEYNHVIYTNILWTVLATSLLYYILLKL